MYMYMYLDILSRDQGKKGCLKDYFKYLLNSFIPLPELSDPRGIITSAYFFV